MSVVQMTHRPPRSFYRACLYYKWTLQTPHPGYCESRADREQKAVKISSYALVVITYFRKTRGSASLSAVPNLPQLTN